MSMPIPKLEGSRIRLRPLRADDVDALYALHSDSQVMRYWSRTAWTDRAESISHLGRMAQAERDGDIPWAIARREDDVLIGSLSLFQIVPEHARGMFGYACSRLAGVTVLRWRQRGWVWPTHFPHWVSNVSRPISIPPTSLPDGWPSGLVSSRKDCCVVAGKSMACGPTAHGMACCGKNFPTFEAGSASDADDRYAEGLGLRTFVQSQSKTQAAADPFGVTAQTQSGCFIQYFVSGFSP